MQIVTNPKIVNDYYPYIIAGMKIRENSVVKDITFHRDYNSGEYGCEIYQGWNYVVDPSVTPKSRSYSRQYKMLDGLPEKYIPFVRMCQVYLDEYVSRYEEPPFNPVRPPSNLQERKNNTIKNKKLKSRGKRQR